MTDSERKPAKATPRGAASAPDRAKQPLGTRALRPLGPVSRVAFWCVRAVLRTAFRLWFRLRIENRPKLDGAYVLAPNHVSFLDPLLVGACHPRPIVNMMTVLIYRSPWTGWFYRWNRSIPVEAARSNRDALRAAREVLRNGEVLGIYPEGGISRDGKLMLGNPGAVSLVVAEGVPVVPVGIVGAEKALGFGRALPLPRKVVVRFGEPILAEEITALAEDRKLRLEKATALIMSRIAALTEQPSREEQLVAAAASS